MKLSKIAAIDDLVQGAGSPIGPGSDPVAVGAVQDLLSGHGYASMPGLLGDGRGRYGPRTTSAVASFCQEQGLAPIVNHDGLMALISVPAVAPIASQAYITLVLDRDFTAETKLVSLVTRAAGAGRFGSLLLNTGHGGLGAGILPWIQRTGGLHDLLAKMDADSEGGAILTELFGGGLSAMIAHTGKPDGGLDSAGNTVDSNFDLVSEPWRTYFTSAGLNTTLQALQVDIARATVDDFFKNVIVPKMPLLSSERGVAFAVDLIIQFGPVGAKAIYDAAAASGPDAFIATRMRDLSVDRLRQAFKNVQQVAQAAQDRRNFLLTTDLLSDDPFVPDAGPAPTTAKVDTERLRRYFLPPDPEQVLFRPAPTTDPAYFIKGEEALKHMAADIAQAKNVGDFIYMLNWYCDCTLELVDSDPGSTLTELLTKANGNNVEIRGIFWDIPPDVLDQLRRNPALREWLEKQLSAFDNFETNEATCSLINGLPATTPASLRPVAVPANDTRLPGTHHQKLLVLGQAGKLVAYVGGIEYNPDRLKPTGAPGTPLFDYNVRLEGHAAWLALQVFISRWTFNEVARTTTLSAETLPMPPTPSGSVEVQFTQTRGSGSDGFPAGIRTAADAISNAIRGARRFFYIEDQYFVGNPQLIEAITAALVDNPSLRGIVVVTPKEDVTDFPDTEYHRRDFLKSIALGLPGSTPASPDWTTLSDQLMVFERKGTDGSPQGEFAYVHSKLVIVDDEAAFVGSVNMNRRGWSHDTEVDATIVDMNGPAGTGPGSPGWVRQFRCDMWQQHLGVACSGDIAADLELWEKPSLLASVLRYTIGDPGPAQDPGTRTLWNYLYDPA